MIRATTDASLPAMSSSAPSTGRAPLVVVGLTGGIASGKSTVARLFRERGVPVIDADQISRAVVVPPSPVLDRIAAHFGAEMLLPDGTLDRARLGAHVFADPEALEILNRLVHPAILAQVAARMVELQREGHPWAAYEAALVLESGLAPGLGALVCVVAGRERQLERILARDDLDEERARARIDAQTNDDARRSAADHVIENAGTLEALEARTHELLDALVERFGEPLPRSG